MADHFNVTESKTVKYNVWRWWGTGGKEHKCTIYNLFFDLWDTDMSRQYASFDIHKGTGALSSTSPLLVMIQHCFFGYFPFNWEWRLDCVLQMKRTRAFVEETNESKLIMTRMSLNNFALIPFVKELLALHFAMYPCPRIPFYLLNFVSFTLYFLHIYSMHTTY